MNVPGISVASSGTNVNWGDPVERGYFANTLVVLDRHGLISFAKLKSDQLVQERIDSYGDVVVVMNQRVMDEAIKIVQLPENVFNWDIIDIGEGHRTNIDSRESYEEEIYQEIKHKVDDLIDGLNYSSIDDDIPTRRILTS
jgi:ferredoxin-fold anticodon binding domain-containing protein